VNFSAWRGAPLSPHKFYVLADDGRAWRFSRGLELQQELGATTRVGYPGCIIASQVPGQERGLMIWPGFQHTICRPMARTSAILRVSPARGKA